MLSLGYTGALLPYSAWGAELAGDYRERSRVTAFREGFTLTGTLLAIALPFAIGLGDGTGLHGLAVLGLAVAAALMILGGITVATVPNRANMVTPACGLRTAFDAWRQTRRSCA